jgi:hypothetical protein
LVAACPSNDLKVGNVDANPPSSDAKMTSDGGSAGSAGSKPCQSSSPAPKTTKPGTIVAAGKGSDGTIYVVDDVSHRDGITIMRVFKSNESGALDRQRVAGESKVDYVYDFYTSGPAQPFTLQIEMPAGGRIRMGVMQGNQDASKKLVIGQDGEELPVLPNAAVASMPMYDLANEIVLEYSVSLPDGRAMVVIRPRDDWSYSDFRLFLGPSEALSERVVTGVIRFSDGGTTTIRFDDDGQPAEAYFPVVFADGGFADGPATLTVSGATIPLTRQSAAPIATYLCL